MELNLSELISSKKFKVLVGSILGIAGAVCTGALEVADALNSSVMLIMAYLGAQGLADIGKSSTSTSTQTVTDGSSTTTDTASTEAVDTDTIAE